MWGCRIFIQKGDINLKELFKLTTRITEGLVERELLGLSLDKKKLTAGEQLFLKYKATGIRGGREVPIGAKLWSPCL